MLDIIKIIAPIFGIIFLGFSALFLKLITKEQLKAIGNFVIKIALPCMLVVNISAQQIEKIWQPQYVISYGVVSIFLFMLILLVYRYLLKQPLDEAALMAMGSSMSNTGFIGSAVLQLILGASATIYFAMTLIIENFVVFLGFVICLEISRHKQRGLAHIILQTIINTLKNPIIISLIIGISFSVLQLHLPSIVQKTLEPIGKSASPIGLFVVGGSLYGITTLKNIWRDSGILIFSKMILMPILVYLMFLAMPNTNPEMIFSGVLLASVSMATIFTIFGQSIDKGEKTSAILLLSTLTNIVTLTLVVTLLLPR